MLIRDTRSLASKRVDKNFESMRSRNLSVLLSPTIPLVSLDLYQIESVNLFFLLVCKWSDLRSVRFRLCAPADIMKNISINRINFSMCFCRNSFTRTFAFCYSSSHSTHTSTTLEKYLKFLNLDLFLFSYKKNSIFSDSFVGHWNSQQEKNCVFKFRDSSVFGAHNRNFSVKTYNKHISDEAKEAEGTRKIIRRFSDIFPLFPRFTTFSLLPSDFQREWKKNREDEWCKHSSQQSRKVEMKNWELWKTTT